MNVASLLAPQVLKHLTVKRTLDVNRMEFFAQVRAVSQEPPLLLGANDPPKRRSVVCYYCPAAPHMHSGPPVLQVLISSMRMRQQPVGHS